ncbi:MAG: META domain-containing protein [Devosia sp.]
MRVSIAVLLTGLLLATPALAARIDLNGQVTYHERIALPDTATLEIQLVDQTLPSLPPRLDIKAPIGHGQVPLSFTLNFDDAIIIPTHEYALIASIGVDSGLLFRNFQPYRVNPLTPEQPVVIVTNLVGQVVKPGASSTEPTEPPQPAILDSVWTAISIGDAAVLARTRPTLTIGPDMRAGGSGGCNSWFAPAALDGETLHLGTITTTLKACSQAINLQEDAFKTGLAAAASWQVDKDRLTLFGADGQPLMVFER